LFIEKAAILRDIAAFLFVLILNVLWLNEVAVLEALTFNLTQMFI